VSEKRKAIVLYYECVPRGLPPIPTESTGVNPTDKKPAFKPEFEPKRCLVLIPEEAADTGTAEAKAVVLVEEEQELHPQRKNPSPREPVQS